MLIHDILVSKIPSLQGQCRHCEVKTLGAWYCLTV